MSGFVSPVVLVSSDESLSISMLQRPAAFVIFFFLFHSRATRLYTPLCRSVGRSVGPLLTFSAFFKLFGLTAPSQMPLKVIRRFVRRSVRPFRLPFTYTLLQFLRE